MIVYKSVILCILFCHMVNAHFFECSDASDCKALDATCDGSLCKCPSGQLISSQGNKCLKVASEFGNSCEEDIQCVRLNGRYACKEKKCKCEDDWIYAQGRCRPLKKLGDDCNENIDCYDGFDFLATVCKANKCTCQSGYYIRSGKHCRKESLENDYCAFDIDCKFNNGICNDGKCEKRNTKIVEGKIHKEHEEFENYVKAVPQKTDDDQCTTPNFIFSKLVNDCVCKPGYFKNKKECAKELGSPCTDNSECKGASGVCVNNLCTCDGKKLADEKTSKCRDSAFAPTFKCNNDQSCKLFLNNYKCDPSETIKTCKCLSSFFLNQDGVCEKGVACSDEDCDAEFKNSVCSNLETCVCASGFYEEKGKCLPSLGTKCKDDEIKCEIANSECVSDVCKCKDGYLDTGKNECIKESTGLGGDCDTDIQCTSKISNSTCDIGKCVCEKSFEEINQFCIKTPTRIGDFCTNKKMCGHFGDGSICRKNKCACDKGFVAYNNEKCISKDSKNSSRVQKVNLSLIWLSLVIFYNFL